MPSDLKKVKQSRRLQFEEDSSSSSEDEEELTYSPPKKVKHQIFMYFLNINWIQVRELYMYTLKFRPYAEKTEQSQGCAKPK